MDAVGAHRDLPHRAGSHRIRRKLHLHREGPSVRRICRMRFSNNPFIRPDDYRIPITAQHHDDKTVRNISCHGRKSSDIRTRCGKGYQFYCVTPKTRHRVHSQWSVNDWVQIYESNFGDPYRMDKRTPRVGEHQLHINPRRRKTAASTTATTCLYRRETRWTGPIVAGSPRIRSIRSPA